MYIFLFCFTERLLRDELGGDGEEDRKDSLWSPIRRVHRPKTNVDYKSRRLSQLRPPWLAHQGLEAVDVHGFNPRQKGKKQGEADTRRSTGLQAPRVLKLRTCKKHRQRVILLHNEDVGRRWCNGGPCRLLTHDSWTGKQGCMRLNPDGKTLAVTQVVYLEDTERFPEFNVKVIRDEEHTLAQPNRFRPEDICIAPSRHDSTSNGYGEQHFQQVSLAIAAAMTCHKVQGLTIPQIYFCLHQIWGFGIPYTAFTRTPFKADIALVGVPPRDIFSAIFASSPDEPSLIMRKRREIEATLLDVATVVDADIKAGRLAINVTAELLMREMTPQEKEDFATFQS